MGPVKREIRATEGANQDGVRSTEGSNQDGVRSTEGGIQDGVRSTEVFTYLHLEKQSYAWGAR